MIRIGLIGCGYISKRHIQTLCLFDDMSLTAVSDLQPAKMEAAIQLYGEKEGMNKSISRHQDYHTMLRDPNVDAVIICTLSSLHAEIAKKALIQGKHIIIEKPIALSLKEATELIQLSKQRKKTVLVCHQLRYRPLLQKVKDIVDRGYLGKLYLGVTSIRLNRSPAYYSSATWKGTWAQDGGMLVNQGVHLIDLLVWLLGDMTSIYGEIVTKDTRKETEDIGLGTISFNNGAKGIIEANTMIKPKNIGYYLSLFGDKGSICIGGPQFNELDHCYIEDHPELVEVLHERSEELNEHELMYKDFIASISMKQPVLVNAEEAKRTMEAIFSIYESSKWQRPITLPLESFATTDMLDNRKRNHP